MSNAIAKALKGRIATLENRKVALEAELAALREAASREETTTADVKAAAE